MEFEGKRCPLLKIGDPSRNILPAGVCKKTGRNVTQGNKDGKFVRPDVCPFARFTRPDCSIRTGFEDMIRGAVNPGADNLIGHGSKFYPVPSLER